MNQISTAKKMVEERLLRLGARMRLELAIDEENVSDRGWCIVLPYNTRAYLERGDQSADLAGNGPFVFLAASQTLLELRPGEPIEGQLKALQQEHGA